MPFSGAGTSSASSAASSLAQPAASSIATGDTGWTDAGSLDSSGWDDTTASDAADGVQSLFNLRNGGRVGYADGGSVGEDDDGTYLAADAGDDTETKSGGLLDVAAMGDPSLLAATDPSLTGGLLDAANMPSAVQSGGVAPAPGSGGIADGVPAGSVGAGSSSSPIDPVLSGQPSGAPSGAGLAANVGPATVQQLFGAGGSGGVVSPDGGSAPSDGGDVTAAQQYLKDTEPPAPPPALYALNGGAQDATTQVNLGPDAVAPAQAGGPASAAQAAPTNQLTVTAPPSGGIAPAAKPTPAAAAVTPAGGIAAAVTPRIDMSASPASPLPKPPPSSVSAGGIAQAAAQPQPGTAGTPAVAGSSPNTQPARPQDWLDRLYGRGGNSGALALLSLSGGILASRDPHFSVALGQGINAMSGQMNSMEQSRQQQGMRMLQMQNNHDYQMAMAGTRQQNADTAANRAATYAGVSDARTQQMSAQMAVQAAKASLGPKATAAGLQATAIASYKQINPGASDYEAYAATKNYLATNDYHSSRLGQIDQQQANIQANRDRIAAQNANQQELIAARTIMQTQAQMGKTVNLSDALQQVRSARANNGPALVPGSSAATPQYSDGQTATGANGQKLVYSGGAWQPAQAAATPAQ